MFRSFTGYTFDHKQFNSMKFLSLIIFLGSVVIGSSQSQFISNDQADPAATEILDQISGFLGGQTAIKIDFTIDFQTDLNAKAVQEKGVLFLSGQKYFLAYANQTIISDGTLLWVYQQDLNEVTINNIGGNDAEFSLNPSQFLNFYKTMDVSYALVFEGTESGKSVQKIEFKPLDSNQMVTKIRMTAERSANKILRIKAFLRDGSVYTLHMDSYKINPTMEAGLFTFSPDEFKGIHIEDLRID